MPRNFSEATKKKRALREIIKFLQSPKVEVREFHLKNHVETVQIGYMPHHMDTGFRTLTLTIFQKPKRKYSKKVKCETVRRKSKSRLSTISSK